MKTILLTLFFVANILFCFGQDSWDSKSVTDNHAYKIESTAEFNTFIKEARRKGDGVIYNPNR